MPENEWTSTDALTEDVRWVLREGRDAVASEESPGASGLALMKVLSQSLTCSPGYGTAGRIALWLVESRGSTEDAECFAHALAVVDSPAAGDPLSDAFRDLVRRVVENTIDDDELAARLRAPVRPTAAEAKRVGVVAVEAADPADAVDTTASAATLQRLIASRDTAPDLPHPRNAWLAFLDFARLPVSTAAPNVVAHEAVFFEWGESGDAFESCFVRQFSLEDELGTYVRMEQLRCEFAFSSSPRLAALGEGDIWGDPDQLEAWIHRVEGAEAFEALLAEADPVSFLVYHEEV